MAEFFGTTVADIFNTMPKRFKPGEAKDEDIVIGYECKGDGGGKWRVHIKNGTIRVEEVAGELSGCKMSVHAADAETFIGVTLGKIAAIEVLTSGKLRVVGDPRVLMTLLPKIFVPYTAPEKKSTVVAKDIIATIQERFRPDKAAGVEMKIGYDLTGEGGGQWTIVIQAGKCAVKEGIAGDLNVKMTMPAEVYTGMMLGTISGETAFTSGQVKIDGDMMAAGATSRFFSKYVDPNARAGEAEELITIKVVNSVDCRFATGTVYGMWFKGLKEKKFLANVCPKCGRTQITPREICAFCRVRCNEWVALGPKGTITAADIVYFASPDPLTGAVRETPYAMLWVLLDNASAQEAFCLDIKREDLHKMKVGDRVRPVWAEKRTGSFRDILCFELDQ
jgi:uncharacterized OB-fold protein/putative sterol carrier protein